MSSKLLLFSLFIHGFQTTLVSNLKPHCFHLDSSLKRSSKISNWLSRIPTQYSLVNSELLLFITIQYTINTGLWWVSIPHFCYFYHELDYYNVSLNPWLVLFFTLCTVLLFVFKIKENNPIHGFPRTAFLYRGIVHSWDFTYCFPIIPCKPMAFRSSNMDSWYGCHFLP